MSREYKYKYVVLKVGHNNPKDILRDALTEYIKKLQKDIELYSHGTHGGDARITVSAERMVQAMEWRDRLQVLGSDVIYSPSDISDFHIVY